MKIQTISNEIVKKVLINGSYENYIFRYISENNVCIPAIRDTNTGTIVYRAY
jgi:hypothetical protein